MPPADQEGVQGGISAHQRGGARGGAGAARLSCAVPRSESVLRASPEVLGSVLPLEP